MTRLSERVFAWLFFSSRRTYATVFLATLTLYLLTTHYGPAQVSDTQAAIWPAYEFVHHGTFHLDHVRGLPANAWFYRPQGALVAGRMMGVVLAGVPVCALLAWTPLDPAQLNGVNAAVLTAVAVTVLFAALRRLVPSRTAIGATATIAFGTSVWTVAAGETWPHTVDVLSLSLMFLALARGRVGWAGIALIPGLLARPHLALVAFILGIGLSLTRRSWRPLFGFGLPAASAFGMLLIWNHSMFGAWNLLGTYSNKIGVLQSSSETGLSYLVNLRHALLAPEQGVLLFTPVAVLAIGWTLRRTRTAPDWTGLALLSGVVYELVQLKLEDYQGGGGFVGSRYTLEMLMLGVPLLVACYPGWAVGHRGRRFATNLLAAAGIVLFATCAFSGSYRAITRYPHNSLTSFYAWRVVLVAGTRGSIVVTITITLFILFAIGRYHALFRRPTGAIITPRDAVDAAVALEPQR